MQLNFVLGTAAELIKVYPLIALAIEKGEQVRVIATGQSRENFLMQYRDLQLPEDKLKSLLVSSGDLKKVSSALAWFVRAVRVSKKAFLSLVLNDGRSRSFIVVHGDTLSTLVGAFLAKKAKLPLVHVEAGLRSASWLNPFPEEINRRLVSRMAQYHMAPDEKAVSNLRRSHASGLIVSTQGNTLLDAVRLLPESKKDQGGFALVNVHRFENLNSSERWSIVVDTVLKSASKRRTIFVAHPQTLHKLDIDRETRSAFQNARVEIRERMPFSEFLTLLKGAEFLISDGGSNQEECSYLGKPCLLLRLETERQEGLSGCCVLSKFDRVVIDRFLDNPKSYAAASTSSTASPSRLILDSLSAT